MHFQCSLNQGIGTEGLISFFQSHVLLTNEIICLLLLLHDLTDHFLLVLFFIRPENRGKKPPGLEYDPDNPLLWSNLAVVWIVAGAFQQAAQGLEKALTIELGLPSCDWKNKFHM